MTSGCPSVRRRWKRTGPRRPLRRRTSDYCESSAALYGRSTSLSRHRTAIIEHQPPFAAGPSVQPGTGFSLWQCSTRWRCTRQRPLGGGGHIPGPTAGAAAREGNRAMLHGMAVSPIYDGMAAWVGGSSAKALSASTRGHSPDGPSGRRRRATPGRQIHTQQQRRPMCGRISGIAAVALGREVRDKRCQVICSCSLLYWILEYRARWASRPHEWR